MEGSLIYIVAVLGILAMALSTIPREKFKYGLEMAWLIIFIFLAIRYDFGNDYMSYMDAFNWGVSFDDELGAYRTARESEPGWQFLCNLFRPLGFFTLVALLTAFECYVFYSFIKKYVPEGYYWFAIFFFVFTPSIMLIGCSAMRQMLAIAIFVNSIKYIEQRKFLLYIISIFIASQFHTSALILYPLYFLRYYNARGVIVNSLIVIAYIILLLSSEYMREVIESVASIAGEEETVDYYLENAVFQQGGSGIGNILKVLILVYLVGTVHLRNDNNRIPFLLLIVGTFVVPFSLVIPMMGRLGYYFGVCGMVCYPILLKNDIVKEMGGLTVKRLCSAVVLTVVVMLTIFEYMSFFVSPIWIEKFSTYHTIFEAL